MGIGQGRRVGGAEEWGWGREGEWAGQGSRDEYMFLKCDWYLLKLLMHLLEQLCGLSLSHAVPLEVTLVLLDCFLHGNGRGLGHMTREVLHISWSVPSGVCCPSPSPSLH